MELSCIVSIKCHHDRKKEAPKKEKEDSKKDDCLTYLSLKIERRINEIIEDKRQNNGLANQILGMEIENSSV